MALSLKWLRFVKNIMKLVKIYHNAFTGNSVSESMKGEDCMYLTVKQQIKHLSKKDYRTIKELCHTAKNLTNEAIYNIRQHYFAEGEFLKYEKNYRNLTKNPI